MTMKPTLHILKRRAAGLGLIEILVGIAVIGILMAVAVPSMSDLLERRRVIAAAEEVAGVLTYAKAETNAINGQLMVRFDPDTSGAMSCVAVTSSNGITGRCQCWRPVANICNLTSTKLLRAFQLPSNHVQFSAAATTWGVPTDPNIIRFDRDQLTIDATGFHVDVVSNRNHYTLRVEVNAAGRVKTCAPNGDMSGYSTCV